MDEGGEEIGEQEEISLSPITVIHLSFPAPGFLIYQPKTPKLMSVTPRSGSQALGL